MNTSAFVPLLIFWNMSHCFCMIKFMKNVNTFQIAEIKPQKVLPDICLIFFQPGVAYESVACKKRV